MPRAGGRSGHRSTPCRQSCAARRLRIAGLVRLRNMSKSRFLLVLSTAGLATVLLADRADRTFVERRTSSLKPPVRLSAARAIPAPPPPPPPPATPEAFAP